MPESKDWGGPGDTFFWRVGIPLVVVSTTYEVAYKPNGCT